MYVDVSCHFSAFRESMASKVEVDQAALTSLIEKFGGQFSILPERNKVICILTNHELPCSASAIEKYIQGKRYQRLSSKLKLQTKEVSPLYMKYKEFFVPSKKNSSRLYCTLTKKEVNKLPHEIEKYVTGYKFQKKYLLHKESGEPQLDIQSSPKEKLDNVDDNEKDVCSAEEAGMWVPSGFDSGDDADNDEDDNYEDIHKTKENIDGEIVEMDEGEQEVPVNGDENDHEEKDFTNGVENSKISDVDFLQNPKKGKKRPMVLSSQKGKKRKKENESKKKKK